MNNETADIIIATNFYNYVAHRIRARLKADLSEEKIPNMEFEFQLDTSKLSEFIYEKKYFHTISISDNIYILIDFYVNNYILLRICIFLIQ